MGLIVFCRTLTHKYNLPRNSFYLTLCDSNEHMGWLWVSNLSGKPLNLQEKTPGGKTISLKSAALTVTQKQHKNKVPDKSSKKSSQGKESSMTWKNIIDDENWQKTVAQNEKTWRVFLKKNSSFYLLMQVKLFLEKKEELCVIWWPESFISWNIRKILLKNM